MAGGRKPYVQGKRKNCKPTRMMMEMLEERTLLSAALSQVPALSSRPSAAVKIYLDFNGQAGLHWGSYTVPDTPAYTMDGDVTSFSDAELAGIRDVWARVSEKYSPFNVDVTTIDPGAFTAGKGVHVVIGGDGAWTGTPGTGGLSYFGNFSSGYADSISWVFGANFSGSSYQIGEASAHEAGHTFGLFHQSSYSGSTKTAEYNRGDSLRAPIMGNSYFAQRGIWWYGTSKSSSTMQDDLAMLSSVIAYRADDHSNSTTAGDPFSVSGQNVSASGVIEKTSDVDSFTFTTGAGLVSFTGNVNSVAAMLDLKLSLYNAGGGLVANVDTASLGETLLATVPAGTYTLVVGSHGAYGDVGQYTVNGTIVSLTNPAPAAPSGLSATVSGTQINLAWNDNATNETGYVVQRSSDGGSNYSNVATLGAGTKGWTDSSGAAGGSYAYRVYATGSGGNSGYSNSASASLPAASAVPATPGGVTVTGIAANALTVSWSDTANETIYYVQQSTDGGSTWTQVGTTAANVNSFTSGGLVTGKTYWFRIWAGNGSGVSSPSSAASATTSASAPPPTAPPPATSAPSTPTGLKTTAVTANSISISWTDTANETIYYVQQSTNGGSTWTQVGTTAANVNSFTSGNLVTGQTYWLRVWAGNSAGVSSPSAAISAVASTSSSPPPGGIPSTPVGLQVTAVTKNSISISWADNSNETIYYIQQSTNGGATWTQVGTTAANVNTFTSGNLAGGQSYWLRVWAGNASGTSSPSAAVSGTTPLAAEGTTALAAESSDLGIWASTRRGKWKA